MQLYATLKVAAEKYTWSLSIWKVSSTYCLNDGICHGHEVWSENTFHHWKVIKPLYLLSTSKTTWFIWSCCFSYHYFNSSMTNNTSDETKVHWLKYFSFTRAALEYILCCFILQHHYISALFTTLIIWQQELLWRLRFWSSPSCPTLSLELLHQLQQ